MLNITNRDVSTDIASIGFGCPRVLFVRFDDIETFPHECVAQESGTSEHVYYSRLLRLRHLSSCVSYILDYLSSIGESPTEFLSILNQKRHALMRLGGQQTGRFRLACGPVRDLLCWLSPGCAADRARYSSRSGSCLDHASDWCMMLRKTGVEIGKFHFERARVNVTR